MSTRMSRAAAITGLAGIALIGLAPMAAAHVTANPRTAEQGSYTKVSFRVPNEQDDASTTKLQIDLPMDHPVASVSVRPTPGWSIKVEKSKLKTPLKSEGGEITEAVSRITWSGGKIDPGQFQEFDVSMGPLPTDTNRMLFKAAQTYSNGDVVNWDQDPGTDESNEPEHPSPSLQLLPKGSASASPTSATALQTAATKSTSTSTDDGTARLLGGLGLAVGVIGLGVGGFGLVRSRS